MLIASDSDSGGVSDNLVKKMPSYYYYGLWTKHIAQYMDATGASIPRTVVEIGPGSTLGAGLSALLTGARRYFAFELVQHTTVAENLEVLKEIAHMIKAREGVRNARGFPNYTHVLNDQMFADRFFTEKILKKSLSARSIKSIARALKGNPSDHTIRYTAPWEDQRIYGPLKDKVDFIFSHSVMEHVADIDQAYRIMAIICKPGGGMSHQIDFRSHGLSRPWDNYRAMSDEEWSNVCEGRPYTINREPPSRHIERIKKNGFQIVRLLPKGMVNSINRNELTLKFRNLSDSDLVCGGIFIQAIKNESKGRFFKLGNIFKKK